MAAQKTAASGIVALTIFSALLGAGIAFVVARSISSPLTKLKNAAVEIGSGKLDTKIEITPRDELGILGASFNRMTEELKKSRDELVTSKSYTDNIITSMVDTLVALDPEARITRVNFATLALLGYEEGELIGQPVTILFEEEEDSIFKGSRLQKLIEEGALREYAMIYKTKTGEKIPVSFSGSVMKGKDGNLVGIVGIARDMRLMNKLMQSEKEFAAAAATAETEKRKAKELQEAYATLQQTQTQLVQAAKLAGLGELGAGIAHELNQPITTIQGFAQRIKRNGARQIKDHAEELDLIINASHRMTRIVNNIRLFSRQSDFKPQPIDPLTPPRQRTDAHQRAATSPRHRGRETSR